MRKPIPSGKELIQATSVRYALNMVMIVEHVIRINSLQLFQGKMQQLLLSHLHRQVRFHLSKKYLRNWLVYCSAVVNYLYLLTEIYASMLIVISLYVFAIGESQS